MVLEWNFILKERYKDKAMSYVAVKNIKNTQWPKVTADYTDWLNFWEKQANRKSKECKVIGCLNKADNGALVNKVLLGLSQYCEKEDLRLYIMPMCDAHCSQNNTDIMDVFENDLFPIRQTSDIQL